MGSTDQTNPIDQLAAEAWQEIQYYYTPDMTGHTGQTGEVIIKSAIEKAVEGAFTEHVWKFSDDWTDGAIRAMQKRIKELESRDNILKQIAATPSGGGEWTVEPVKHVDGTKWEGLAYVIDGSGRVFGSFNEQQAIHLVARINTTTLRDCGNDTKRLDWLESMKGKLSIERRVTKNEWAIYCLGFEGWLYATTIREAIDAAMLETGEQTKENP